MYRITKRIEISGSHYLELPYESKCKNLHGHNWIINIDCEAIQLTKYGMVVDFTVIKKIIHDTLDHQNFNKIFNFNPTAEKIAWWILTTLNKYFVADTNYPPQTRCVKVTVQESEGNTASYEEK